MEEDKVIYRELSYRVMEAVFEVHNTLGPGFIESIYEEALAYEFELRGIAFERQRAVVVTYKGKKVGSHRLDMVAEGKIILELKATSAIIDEFKSKTKSYLAATGYKLGIIVNFGAPRVESVRVAN